MKEVEYKEEKNRNAPVLNNRGHLSIDFWNHKVYLNAP